MHGSCKSVGHNTPQSPVPPWHVDVYDPLAIKKDVDKYFNIKLLNFNEITKIKYDCVIVGVPHDCFLKIDINSLLKKKSIVFDIKGIFKEKYERL